MNDLAAKVQQIKPAEKFRFGEWLPDLPDLDNPGLTEANNVLWTGGSYVPYQPLVPSGFQVPGGSAVNAARGLGGGGTGIRFVASTDGNSNFLSGALGGSFNLTNLTGPPLAASSLANFAQYGTTMFYTDGVNSPQYCGLTLANTFAKLTGPQGDAPVAGTIGVIGQFVILAGLTNNPNSLQWSSINQPFNWPTPGSANAIASQAGSQFLDYTLGAIYGVSQGDQWGLIIHQAGITRVQYVGGDVVFQFDNIYRGPTATNFTSWIKFGGRIYSCGGDGFIVTDGVTVKRIGDARVDRWFKRMWGGNSFNIAAGADVINKQIMWTFATSGTGTNPNTWIAYNYLEDRWTHGTDGIQCFVRNEESSENPLGVEVFTSAGAQQGGGYGATLTGTPGVGVITTAEIELNPGGRALFQGFRPQIVGLPGGAATVRIGSRARLGDQVAFTPILQLNGQTNFADALVDANYHRAELTLNGNFTQAIGGEFKAEPSGFW